MLIGQARLEATRHEQKRAQAADRIPKPDKTAPDKKAASKDPASKDGADTSAQLVALTRRAVLMEAQVDLLEGKRKALARHRAAIADIADAAGVDAADLERDAAAGEIAATSTSRSVLNAQEDLRREIARAMHDGPAQSLTNIVLQAQIVERLLDRDPSRAKGELGQLVSMVQQTIEATKSFIFDVRPMVLDDLGLTPTLRRAARDRGRRAHVAVEFETLGSDRRLPMEVESAVFRILDEALAGYLGQGADRMSIQLDWTEELEALITTHRAAATPEGEEPLPEVPTGDVPDAIKQMIQDRHDARQAAAEAAEVAAVVVLPAATRRDITERAATIGATVEFISGGGELRLVVPAGTGESVAST